MNIHLSLPAVRAVRFLTAGLAVLIVMHLIGVVCRSVFHLKAAAYITLFDMDLESNLPTFYNCALFFICAVLFWTHAQLPNAKKRYGWIMMAGACLFLGVDEGSQVHERFMLVTVRLLNNGSQNGTDLGWLYYAWVIPYALATFLFLLTLTRWFFALDKRMRNGFMISGLVYAAGAVVMEMFSGRIAERIDPSTIPVEAIAHLSCDVYPTNSCYLYADHGYVFAYTVEEILEMSALVICIGTLMTGLGREKVSIRIATAPAVEPQA